MFCDDGQGSRDFEHQSRVFHTKYRCRHCHHDLSTFTCEHTKLTLRELNMQRAHNFRRMEMNSSSVFLDMSYFIVFFFFVFFSCQNNRIGVALRKYANYCTEQGRVY